MNKFSLTSIHCSQQFNYTADDNFLDKFSLSARTDEFCNVPSFSLHTSK